MPTKILNTDLPDSEKDKAKMQPEETILNIPDVKDIPGQENIHVPELREMADTTISSDDEEGVGLFDEDEAEYSSERLPLGEELSEADLIIGGDKLEAKLDQQDNFDKDADDDLGITNDSVSEASDVTPDEVEALERTENTDSQDNENLYRAELDNEDFEGEKLNEAEDFSGEDLDIPGEEEDDANEEIGEEDEENNAYSLGDNQ